ncbi:MAG TPA: guanosine monophosphate reductase [Nanoarchaeota archaeon]|nr:guanosine monophosphate reductase [Nanoarchaeota archaeon]HIH63750.1 guanosine monophosphate reductase [Nanoarchaeota archaeon]HIJ09623.1 guanosine monophosphate reductase [Nanoarchaeota archaeon]
MARVIGGGYSFDDVLIVPKYNKVKSRKDVDFKTKVTRNYEIGIPFIASNMDTICESRMAIAIGKLGGLGVLHRFMSINDQVKEVKKVKGENLICAAAIGVKDLEERVPLLVDAGVNILVLDVAHGHSKYVGKALDWIKEHYPFIDVMVGNIATKDAAHYFLTKGADAIKVGIGPGSMCTTRMMTGVGVPQITAIIDVYEETQGKIPLCADGGITIPGNVTKAIGAGADCVMVGHILAGTTETPCELININGKEFKDYRGMASYDATLKRLKLDGRCEDEIVHIEGEKTRVLHKGKIEPIIKKFLGGLASGMTYIGAKNILELRGKVDFIKISSAGYKESIAHGLLKSK